LIPGVTKSSREQVVLARARAIPEGFVRTYGDLSPGAPRFAGSVLHGNDDPDVPWHRVVRADGSFAQGEKQRRRLRKEGVPFAGKHRVDMEIAHLPREALADLV
jgi:methylated-DNA-protein-cysteine methyltransferase-like protein